MLLKHQVNPLPRGFEKVMLDGSQVTFTTKFTKKRHNVHKEIAKSLTFFVLFLMTFAVNINNKKTMLKTILIYGLLLGVLVLALHAIEYFFWVRVHVFEIYGGLIACLFLALGLWFGSKRSNKKTPAMPLVRNEVQITQLGISKRELEVLLLLGKGLSNQEIADTLFVSQNTIKTHTSRLFEKLDVKNRTQAMLKAQEMGLITPESV